MSICLKSRLLFASNNRCQELSVDFKMNQGREPKREMETSRPKQERLVEFYLSAPSCLLVFLSGSTDAIVPNGRLETSPCWKSECQSRGGLARASLCRGRIRGQQIGIAQLLLFPVLWLSIPQLPSSPLPQLEKCLKGVAGA